MTVTGLISAELSLREKSVEAVTGLLDEKATVPFIARYRKEATGNLDETAISLIRDRVEYYRELEKRKDYIIKTLSGKNLLDEALGKKIRSSYSRDEVEDLYLPFREGRKTRAKAAEEKGLKPLALGILAGTVVNLEREALGCVNDQKGVFSVNDVYEGCRDIIAGIINEDPGIRNRLRQYFRREAYLESSVVGKKKQEGQKYRDYFSYREKASAAPAHRVLAVFRGGSEKILSVKIRPDEERALEIIRRMFREKYPKAGEAGKDSAELVEKAIDDSYSRLLLPSLEGWLSTEIKEKADEQSISVFASGLREILLDPPYGNRAVIGVDPGIRTGSKISMLDSAGRLAGTAVLYCTGNHGNDREKNKKGLDIIKGFIDKYKVEAAAVGNGTGSREISAFLKRELGDSGIKIITVNESGASVYSASENARKEFPELDITFRGAVSIGRRLQDPLSELVKISPESIGVGQYQHDINRAKLQKALDDVVASCVNSVGVDLNSAGTELLGYVAGIGKTLAENIVNYRRENGLFKSREELKKVKGIGQSAFQQAAGFLRIRGGNNPLDMSAVHPESYHIARKILEDIGVPMEELSGRKDVLSKIDPAVYTDSGFGLYTVRDIIAELEKPGRDPRKDFSFYSYTDGVESIGDLLPGMVLSGTVTNVTAFGAFVDIGVHQDGLVHKSMISESFVKDPSDFLRVNQRVEVKVLDVDSERKRISLSIRDAGK